VCAQAVKTRHDPMEEVLTRVDVDAAHDSLCDLAEVGGEVEEQIDAGRQEQYPAEGALDRDEAQDEAGARRVAGTHRPTLGFG